MLFKTQYNPDNCFLLWDQPINPLFLLFLYFLCCNRCYTTFTATITHFITNIVPKHSIHHLLRTVVPSLSEYEDSLTFCEPQHHSSCIISICSLTKYITTEQLLYLVTFSTASVFYYTPIYTLKNSNMYACLLIVLSHLWDDLTCFTVFRDWKCCWSNQTFNLRSGSNSFLFGYSGFNPGSAENQIHKHML